MIAQLIAAAVMGALTVTFLMVHDRHWTPGVAPQPEHQRLTAPLPEKRSWRQVTGGDDIVPKGTGSFAGELDLSQLYPRALLCGDEPTLLCGVWEQMVAEFTDPDVVASEVDDLTGCVQCKLDVASFRTHTAISELHELVTAWDGAAA